MPVADRIDLTNIEGSMTNIIHNNADRLYTAQTVRELYDILLSIFRENNLDTNASRRLLSRVIEQHNIKQGLNAIFNSYFKGANMGRDKEKVGGKPKMFKIDEKLKKIVSEDIEKIEVETASEEITVETDGDAVKVEIEPKTAECVDCEISDESSADLDDYAFFSDLNPETDIDDIEINIDDSVDSNTEDSDNVEESKSIKESNDINPDIWKAIGRKFDYVIAERAAEILENLADRALMQDNVEDTYEAVTRAIDDGLFNTADIWEINALYDECELSDNAYSCLIEDLVQIVDTVRSGELDEGLNLTEKLDFKYIRALKDKIAVCYTRQDLEEIGADLTELDDAAIERILADDVTEADIEKMFGQYDFVPDDFGINESKSINEELSYDDIQQMGTKDRHALWMKYHNTDFKNDDEFWDWAESEFPMEFIDESKSIKESIDKEALSVAEFVDWHETTNYDTHKETFLSIYDILDKYWDPNDDVQNQYTAASDADKEAISRIIDKANETATEEPTVYLARAMHKMYVDGYNYQEIADVLGAPVSLVIKMIGPDSYSESLTESKNSYYEVPSDLIGDGLSSWIEDYIEELQSRPDLMDEDETKLVTALKRVLTDKSKLDSLTYSIDKALNDEVFWDYIQNNTIEELRDTEVYSDVRHVIVDILYKELLGITESLTESFNLSDYRNMENAEYDSEIVRTYTVYLPTTEGKDQIDICITRDFEADIDESDDGAWYIGVDVVGTNIDWRKLEDYLKTNYSSNIYATKYYWSDVIQDAEVIVQALVEIDQDDINQFLK